MLSRLPDDIWVVDLDSTKLTPPSGGYDEIPPLPEPEGTILKNHLKQVSFINKEFYLKARLYKVLDVGLRLGEKH